MKKRHAVSGGLSASPSKRRNRLLALEPRILFDGVALHDGTPVEHEADVQDVAASSAPRAADPPAREILFVDSAVPDADTLSAGAREGVIVIRLEAQRDPFEQITEALRQQPGTSAVHLVSHGGSGFISLGGQTITESDLNARSATLAQWRSLLAENADLLVYGCDVSGSDAGQRFIGRLAELTGADVAASSGPTGPAAAGADWILESAVGTIEATPFLTQEGQANYHARLTTQALNGNTGWVPIMIGTNFDPQGDSQAGAADTDLVGDATHANVYAAYDDGGTTNTTADDTMAFRIRIDNPTSSTYFGGVAIVGMDANLDGRIDVFFAVDGRNNGQAVRLFDPGTNANISPNTTSTTALPTGWIASNGIYSFNSANYSVNAVSSSTDPHWNGDNDLGNDGKTDIFVSFKIPFLDIATVLAKASPTDRAGTPGPRGTAGIAGFTKDTVVQYVAMTQTQTGPINGDIGGVGANYDKNATFTSLGTYSAPMSPSNPVPASTTLTITEPIDSDGVLSASEDDATTIYIASNLGDHSKTFAVTISDNASHSVSGTAVYDAGSGKWKVTADLSSLNDGTLTVNAAYDPDNNAATFNTVFDTATVLHDKTAPAIGINQLATNTAGTPTISGTTDLSAGAFVTVTLDTDNVSGTTNIVYRALVVAGIGGVNTWSINTSTATPVSGALPAGGLTSYTKITASAQDAAGNTGTATALNRPTVTTLSTNSTTPTISGTWTNIAGDTLTVTVGGATYTLNPSGNSWSLNLASATPSSGTLSALTAGQTYSVVAAVTRAGLASVSDTTNSELTITNSPVAAVNISGGDNVSGSDTTPAISGTSSNAGGFVLVRLDPNNDGNLSDAVTYSVTPDGNGNWTLDTGAATPLSGIVPSGGFTGTIGVLATNATGTVADTQTLTVATPTVAVSSIISTASSDSFGIVNNAGAAANWLNVTEDNAVTISGTATSGYAVNLVISDANGNSVSVSGLTVTGGVWSATGLNLSNLDNGTLTVTASLAGTTISAGNTSVAHDKTAPQIFNTTQSILQRTSGATISGTSDLLGVQLTVTMYTDSGYTSAISGQSYTVTTHASTGAWSLSTTTAFPSNTSPIYIRVTPTAQATDTAGNITQKVDQSRVISQSSGNTDQTINVKPVTGDNLVNVSEITSGLTISGETSVTSSTVTVTITDGTTTFTKTGTSGTSYTAGTNNWSVTLTTAEIQSLKNGSIQVSGSVTDASKGVNVTDVEMATLSLPTPTIAITDNVPGTAAGSVTFTFTFSEGMVASGSDAAKAFTVDDITVTNGVKGTFTKVSATEYTLVVTPTASATGNITVSVSGNAAYGAASGRGNAAASATQAFNTTDPTAGAPPALTVDASALETDSTPLITGTTSLPAGSPIVITIDPDNDAATNNSLSYSATVQSGGIWSIDLDSAVPASGTLPATGLYTWAKVTASATNAFGYNTTVTAFNRPTVTSQTTNDTTPTIGGTWTNISGDTLTVTVGGTTYTTGNGLSLSGNTWSLTTTTLTPGTRDVQATTTRSSGTISDSTSNELTIDTTAPTVAITSASTTSDTTPVISGTTDLAAGSSLTITIDPDNDPSTGNSVSYIVIVETGSGVNTWRVDTGTAVPASGSFPANGLAGNVGVTATGVDTAGNSTSATQSLNVDIIPPVISITSNSKTPLTSPVIAGTTDLAAGSTITLVIDTDNVAGGPTYTYTATVQTGGTWRVDTSTAIPSGSGAPIAYLSGNTLGLTATAIDMIGNAGTANKAVQITAAPTVTVTTPVDAEAGQNSDGMLTAAEDDAVIIKGTTTAPAGSVLNITLTDGSITISDTALVAGDGSWQIAALNLSSMANGVIAITSSYMDAGGDVYSGTASVLHDKTAGGGVAIDSISSDTGVIADFITRDTTLVFKGSAVAGSSVAVTLTNASSTQIFSTNVMTDSGGNWSVDYSGTSLAAGTYTLTAGSGLATATQTVVIDTSSPLGPLTVTALTTSDATPAITGSATVTAGETLQVTLNGRTYTEGDGKLVLSGNTWTLTIPAADTLGFGTYEVVARITDTAGNVLTDQSSNELVIASDSTAPAAPTLDLTDGSDTGTLNNDDKTGDTTPTIRVTLNGAGATAPVAGDVVKLFESGVEVGSATLNATDITNAYVDITPGSALPAGGKSFTATVTDAAGNTSSGSAALAVTIDTTAPVLASATVSGTTLTLTYAEAGVGMASVNPAVSDFVVSKNGNTAVTVNAVSVDATAKTVTLTLDSAITNADSNVVVSYTAGTNRIGDIAGNEAVDLTDQAVTNSSGDSTAPSAPALSLLAISDSGASSSDAYTNDSTPTVRVALQGDGATAPVAGDVVKIYLDSAQVGVASLTATDITSGFIDMTTSTLGGDGAKSLTATVTDSANNVSGLSAALVMTLDTIVNAPTASLAVDTGTGGDGITSSATLSVGGIEAGAQLQYSADGASWSGTFTPAEGDNTVFVRQIDLAGNIGAAASVRFTLDSTIATPGISLQTDSGKSSSDGITNNGAVSVTGVESGATVEYSTDGTTWGSSFTPVEGSNTVLVRQTDRAGNVSGSASVTYTLDTNAATPALTLQVDSGSSATDRVTNNRTLNLSGVESGATVYYSTDGTNWSTSYALVEGANTVSVRQTDIAGNASAAASISLTLDTTVATPTVALRADTGASSTDRITSDPTIIVGGIEANALVQYSTDGRTWGSSFTATEGPNTVHVRQTDVAGNVSGTASLSFVHEPVPPAPGVQLVDDTGGSGSDRITRNGALSLSGIKDRATIQYSTDGVNWTSTFSPAEGANTVFVRQVLPSGTASLATALSFTLDTRAAPPAIALVTDSGASASDAITNNPSVSVSGVEAGATVQYSTDGTHWTGSVQAAEGMNTVLVRQVDVAGNISGVSSLTYRLDTQVAAPGISAATPNSSGVVSDSSVTVRGIESGASVEYSTNGATWSGGYTAVEGPNTVYVRQTDLAGNVSAASSVSFTLNTLTALPGTGTTPVTTPRDAGTGTTNTTPGGSTGTPATPGAGTPRETAGTSTPSGDVSVDTSRPAAESTGNVSSVTDSLAPIINGTQGGTPSAGGLVAINGFDQSSNQPSGRINLLAGIPLPTDTSRSGNAGPESGILASTDRGFPVSRVQDTNADSGKDGAQPNGRSASGNTAIDKAPQKGNDRLFVYQGIRDTTAQGGAGIDYFVPREAFGHTNANAIVQLDATLLDGSPLPEWLDFDPVSGRFAGRPPAGESISLDIKVVARDNDGREASSSFKVKVEPVNQRQAEEKNETRAPVQRTNSGKDTAQQKTADALPRKSTPFGEQLRMAKPARDPLLARIAGTDGNVIKNARTLRTS